MPKPEKKTAFSFNHSDQVDNFGVATGNAATVKAMFDSRAQEVLDYVNAWFTLLQQTTDSDSGADAIGATAIADLDGQTVQVLLESLRNKLKATIDSASGADFIGATEINDIQGVTVQAILEGLKAFVDAYNAAHKHADSTDHDNRYYTEAELQQGALDDRYYTETELNSGALDMRYPTRSEVVPDGGVAVIVEVYTIVSADNGDGTFTYQDKDANEFIGLLGENGEQIFALQDGDYTPGMNRMEAFINDTLHRSASSGGLIEVSMSAVALSPPESSGAEITFKYYTMLTMAGSGIAVGPQPPKTKYIGKIWIDTSE